MPTPRCAGVLAFGLVFVLAACGGGSTVDEFSSGSPDVTEARRTTTSTTEVDAGAEPDAPGGICTTLLTAAAELEKVPLFLQLDSPDNVVAIRAHLIGDLDLDVFFRAMVTLHQLDGSTSPLGDPRDAIDAYERAAIDAKPLFASELPSQSSINSFQDSLGDPALFLSHQTPIAGALTEAGC